MKRLTLVKDAPSPARVIAEAVHKQLEGGGQGLKGREDSIYAGRLRLLAEHPELLKEMIGNLIPSFSYATVLPKPLAEIKVGTFKSAEELVTASGSADLPYDTHFGFGDREAYQRYGYGKLEIESEERLLGLILLSGEDLGWGEPVSLNALCHRAGILGFEQCPQELPFQLAQQHRELVIAHKRFTFAQTYKWWRPAHSHGPNSFWPEDLPRVATLKAEYTSGTTYELIAHFDPLDPAKPRSPRHQYLFTIRY